MAPLAATVAGAAAIDTLAVAYKTRTLARFRQLFDSAQRGKAA
jgi:hypothetical protein